jgi:hypothetical protein
MSPGLDSSNIGSAAVQQQHMRMRSPPATPAPTREPFDDSNPSVFGSHRAFIHVHRHFSNPDAGQHNHVEVALVKEGRDLDTILS